MRHGFATTLFATVAVLGTVSALPFNTQIASPAAAQSPMVPTSCPEKMGENQSLLCHCDAASTQDGAVWGDGSYTDDSKLCRAAVHAGMISPEGGMIYVQSKPGEDGYSASMKHGVQSQRWGSWGRSLYFTSADQAQWPSDYPARALTQCPQNAQGLSVGQSVSCSCPSGVASGSVWGSGPYTADSPICRAAVHAGKIRSDGGNVRITATAGQKSYNGSTRNGITTSNWGSFSKSYRFDMLN